MFYSSYSSDSSVYFQGLIMKKLSYKYYNKRITTRDKGNVQSHD